MKALSEDERGRILDEIVALAQPMPAKDDDEITIQEFQELMAGKGTMMSPTEARHALQRAVAKGVLTSRKVRYNGHVCVAFRKAG